MEDQVKKEKSMDERQLVVFKLGEEEFGVNISEVREIIRMEEITKIPNTSAYIKGVINLRGGIIVVIDLALKIGLQSKPIDNNTRIIVIEVDESTVGMIVDSATEVIRLTADQVQPAPQMITQKINSDYIEGVGVIDERLLILLDLVKVLIAEDLHVIQQTAASGSGFQGEQEQQPPQEQPSSDSTQESSKQERSPEGQQAEQQPSAEQLPQEQSPQEQSPVQQPAGVTGQDSAQSQPSGSEQSQPEQSPSQFQPDHSLGEESQEGQQEGQGQQDQHFEPESQPQGDSQQPDEHEQPGENTEQSQGQDTSSQDQPQENRLEKPSGESQDQSG
jgi:purine-binding chemotaxis protein CheW